MNAKSLVFTLWVALIAALSSSAATINWYNPNTNYTIARNWSERILESIRMDTPHPPAQARNLFSYSVCMYDAWAAYDTNAVGFIYRGKHTSTNVDAARREAISYAMYRMMVERLAYSRTATNQADRNPVFLTLLGYDTNNVSRDTSAPAGVGNSVYDAVSAWFINDGSRQTNGTPFPLANPPVAYPDYPVGNARRYAFLNGMMDPFKHGTTDGTNNTLVDVNVWQRLVVANAIDQNGFPQNPLQGYAGAPWLWARTFSLGRIDENKAWIDPGPPPFLGGATTTLFLSNLAEVVRYSSQLTTADGVITNISPQTIGNNTLGANDGHGYTNNPVTGLPYTANNVMRGDFARALTEFWADGPSSETPPGHWNAIANHVADDPTTVFRVGGAGPVVDRLQWEVKLYFALNAALHDAACAAWSVKRVYNGWRPISAIRHCGELGQSSNPGLPSYHTNGLPLITNLIELVTGSSIGSGRHAGLTPGKIAIYCWPGQPDFPDTDTSGVHWIHAEDFMPYQKKTFVTPAFPGYISGHSTFSRAAAEIMAAFTGSKWFPNGLGTFTISNLINEFGPTQPVTLQWASYYDAADQVGLSRIWGGIHPPVDDFAGRRVGAQVGTNVWALARSFYNGSVTNFPITLATRTLDTTNVEVRYSAVRSLYYKVLTSTNVDGPYTDGGQPSQRAFEASIPTTNSLGSARKFFRVSGSLAP